LEYIMKKTRPRDAVRRWPPAIDRLEEVARGQDASVAGQAAALAATG
jgi:hypothetical protein